MSCSIPLFSEKNLNKLRVPLREIISDTDKYKTADDVYIAIKKWLHTQSFFLFEDKGLEGYEKSISLL